MSLVLDTGPILALLDRDDPDHERCVTLVEGTTEDLVVPAPVLVEVDYWCRKLLAPEVWPAFLEDVAAGAYRLHNLPAHALVRSAELEQTYEDPRLGLVDAAVIVTCEMLDEPKVATLDRRHFSVVRPRHCTSLRLLPD